MTRNPIAKALRSPHLAPKRVKPKKGRGSYSRKGRQPRLSLLRARRR